MSAESKRKGSESHENAQKVVRLNEQLTRLSPAKASQSLPGSHVVGRPCVLHMQGASPVASLSARADSSTPTPPLPHQAALPESSLPHSFGPSSLPHDLSVVVDLIDSVCWKLGTTDQWAARRLAQLASPIP